MVRHGTNEVMDVAFSKRELQQTPVLVCLGKMTFRQWCKRTQFLANLLRARHR